MIKLKSPVGTISDGGAPIYLDDLIDIQDTQARYGITHLKSIQLNNNGIVVEGIGVSGAGPYNLAQGYVYLDGDLRFFPSTNIAALNGYIVADTDLVESRIFFDGSNNPVKVTKRAKWQAGGLAMGFDGINIITYTAATSEGYSYSLSNYTRGVPYGGIIMWNNNGYIPLGFALCDGSFGTPNLTGKFVRANTAAGATGGSGSFTIGTANLPSHSHTITAEPNHVHVIFGDGGHTHKIRSSNTTLMQTYNWTFAVENVGGNGDEGYVYHSDNGTTENAAVNFIEQVANHAHSGSTGGDGAHAHGGATGNTGSGTAINFVPTYHDLIFIQRIA